MYPQKISQRVYRTFVNNSAGFFYTYTHPPELILFIFKSIILNIAYDQNAFNKNTSTHTRACTKIGADVGNKTKFIVCKGIPLHFLRIVKLKRAIKENLKLLKNFREPR